MLWDKVSLFVMLGSETNDDASKVSKKLEQTTFEIFYEKEWELFSELLGMRERERDISLSFSLLKG